MIFDDLPILYSLGSIDDPCHEILQREAYIFNKSWRDKMHIFYCKFFNAKSNFHFTHRKILLHYPNIVYEYNP